MNYRKQSDGRSRLVYAKEERGERKLAVVRVDPDATPYKAEVERLDAQDSVVREYKLRDLLENAFGSDACFILGLAAYMIVCEDNAAQYDPDYARWHSLLQRACLSRAGKTTAN